MNATPRSISSSVMYSSGWCAWLMEPGPHTIVAMPAAAKWPASVANETVVAFNRDSSNGRLDYAGTPFEVFVPRDAATTPAR